MFAYPWYLNESIYFSPRSPSNQSTSCKTAGSYTMVLFCVWSKGGMYKKWRLRNGAISTWTRERHIEGYFKGEVGEVRGRCQSGVALVT